MSHHLVGMTEIAGMLGVSRQRVAQLVAAYEDFPEPEAELSSGRIWSRTAVETWIATYPDRKSGRPESASPAGHRRRLRKGGGVLRAHPFSRFTPEARRAVVVAQEEARLMNHNYIGTEHLLLGLLVDIPSMRNVALDALTRLGVTQEMGRQHLLEMIGPGDDEPTGAIPFTPRTKKVLELALREALQMGHNFISTEHLLLALVREGDGVAWQILEKCGLEQGEVREVVLAASEEAAAVDPLSAAIAKRPHMYPDITERVETIEARIDELVQRIETEFKRD